MPGVASSPCTPCPAIGGGGRAGPTRAHRAGADPASRAILADSVSDDIVDLSSVTQTLTKELLWEISQQVRGRVRELNLEGWKGVSAVRGACAPPPPPHTHIVSTSRATVAD